jgi:hypothetical protein
MAIQAREKRGRQHDGLNRPGSCEKDNAMRVIVINPWNQTVTEADHNGSCRDYYRLLSGPTIEGYPDASVNCFDITPVGDPDGHIMFVDDEGLLAEVQAHFVLGTSGATFAGRGVIARSDNCEDEKGATIAIADVIASITWLPIGTEISVPQPVIERFDSFDAMLERLEKRSNDVGSLIARRG